MKYVWILLGIGAAGVALILLVAYICYRMAFLVTKQQRKENEERLLPPGKIYEPFHEAMTKWGNEARAMHAESVTIQSFDGLALYAKYYEYAPGAPVELMFHGYRGTAERDLSGGVQRCFALGRSALIVDQRASGRSEGNVISFGINESRDCHSWIRFMLEIFGPDVKIILTGISMGAATVLMAAAKPLPANVIGVLADCGYTSPEDIIKTVIRQMKLPADLAYPFVRLGAKIFGHFDLDETSPVKAMEVCGVPVIFFHGERDDYVPCEMSRRNYDACAAEQKMLVTVPGAGHGLSYVVDPERYLQALRDFFGPEASAN